MPLHSDVQLPDQDARHEGGLLATQGSELVLPLHVEEIAVSRRKIETGVVRVVTVTRTREQQVDEALTHERVEITRVPVGRIVDSVPDIREDGDLTIMPVIEEVVVVERRLMLKEEVHIRRVRTSEHHIETVTLREQDAVITRLPAAGPVRDPVLHPLSTKN